MKNETTNDTTDAFSDPLWEPHFEGFMWNFRVIGWKYLQNTGTNLFYSIYVTRFCLLLIATKLLGRCVKTRGPTCNIDLQILLYRFDMWRLFSRLAVWFWHFLSCKRVQCIHLRRLAYFHQIWWNVGSCRFGSQKSQHSYGIPHVKWTTKVPSANLLHSYRKWPRRKREFSH